MEQTLKFIPIGGVGDVTRNMYVYEYGGDILLVDCGIGFPDADMFGVDLLIPDISYLLDKKDKIRGLVLTHGHEDHIGAIPYILPALPKIPVFGTKLTAGLSNAKLAEFGLGAWVKVAEYNKPIQLGQFSVSFVHITHSIPDSANIVIETPMGTFYHASDFKFDKTPPDNNPSDLAAIAKVGEKGAICLFSDCLRSETKGATETEKTIEERFTTEMGKAKGKFIVTTYSSSIARIQQAINAAEKHKRKVCFVGRSMNQVKDVAMNLGFLAIPPGMEVNVEKIKLYEDHELVLFVAGSQGQENSAMSRIANDDDKYIKITEDDVIVFSSDTIPGNEDAVNSLIDRLSKKGATIFYTEIDDSFHVSGHGSATDLQEMMQLTKPKFLLPIGGTFKHMVQYRKLAMEIGFKKDDIFLVEDGDVIEFTKETAKVVGKVPVRAIYVDDIEGAEVHASVVRDRQKLAEDGVIIALVQTDKEGQVFGDIDIITRGVIDVNHDRESVNSLKQAIKKTLMSHRNSQDRHFQRKALEGTIEKFIFKKSRKRPLVLPIIIQL